MTVLSSLAAVDWVVPFPDDTPERLIRLIMPDVLTKGGDYSVDQVVGASNVRASGGEVRILPFREGRSSSAIIERMS